MSQYEQSYIRWFWRSNARNLLILCSILSMIPLFSYLIMNTYDGDYDKHIPFTLALFFYAGVSLLLAYCMPLYQFRYLMQKRYAELFYAMPIKKGRFFLIQFLLGLCIVLVPPMIAYVCAILCCPVYYAYLDSCLFMIVIIGCLSLSLYGIVSYFTMKCNNLWDACAVNLGYTVAMIMLFIGIMKLARATVQMKLISFSGNGEELLSQEFLLSILSIPASMIYFCSGMCEALFASMSDTKELWNTFFEAVGVNVGYLVYWLVFGLLFAYKAYRDYKKRPQEVSEDRTTAIQCYPVLIILVTTSLLFLCELTYGYMQNVSVINILIVLVLYWTMVCFAKRRIHISKKMIAAFLGMCMLSYSVSFVFVKSNGFGNIHELPRIEDVTSVNVVLLSMNGDLQIPKESKQYEKYKEIPIYDLSMYSVEDALVIAEVYEKQQDIVEVLQMDKKDSSYKQYKFSISYMMEDGQSIIRSYYLDEAMFKEMQPQFVAWLDQGLYDKSLQLYARSYQNQLGVENGE